MTDTASLGTLRTDHGADPCGRCGQITRPTHAEQRAQPRGSRAGRRLASLGVLLSVAVGAAACSSASASSTPAASSSSAAPVKTHRHHAGGPSGVVVSVSSTTLTVHTKSATSTIGLASTTKYREGGTSVTVSDLVAGDHVKIRLAKKSATPTAAVVVIVPPSVTGTVGALDASGFTLSTTSGKTDTVTTSSSTAYRSGKQPASASSLHDGDRVRVSGQLSATTGSISAASITILPAKKT